MTKKVIVYIDGENFLHRVEDSLKLANILNKKEEILHLEVRKLLEKSLTDITYDKVSHESRVFAHKQILNSYQGANK